MSTSERRSYIRQMQPRYQRARKREKQELLDEMELVTEMHRKSLTRLLNSRDLSPKAPKRRPRRRAYGADVEHVVGLVWEALDGICAERLTPALRTTAEHLERFGELVLTDDLRTQLDTISVSTVQRILQRRPGCVPGCLGQLPSEPMPCEPRCRPSGSPGELSPPAISKSIWSIIVVPVFMVSTATLCS